VGRFGELLDAPAERLERVAASTLLARSVLSRYSSSTDWLLRCKRAEDGWIASFTRSPSTATYMTATTPRPMIEVRSEVRS